MINLAPPAFKRRHFFLLFGRAALPGRVLFVDTARRPAGHDPAKWLGGSRRLVSCRRA
jgi:hypothetical protein